MDGVKNTTTEEIRLATRGKCCSNLFYLCRYVLNFTDMEAVPHGELCKFVGSKSLKKLIVGSRGIYKTSICTIGRAIQLAIINPNVRILIVSNTLFNARRLVGQIKAQLESNLKLRELMGDAIPAKPKGTQRWSRDEVELIRDKVYPEATFTAAGVDKQLASGHYDFILADDVVAAKRDDVRDDVIILPPEYVEKAIGWHRMNTEGLEILRKGKANKIEIQYVLNRWGVFDFARWMLDENLFDKDNPDGYNYLEMAGHRPDGSLLWPTVMTEKFLKKKRKALGDFLYFTQIECKPYNPKDRGFPVEWNMYWHGMYPPGYDEDPYGFRIYLLIDLADASRPANCNTAMVVLWIDRNRHIWVGEAIRGKMDTNEKIRTIHKLVQQYSLRKVYIEENLYRETLEFTLRHAMKAANVYYSIEVLKHKNRNKDARIMRLQPHHEGKGIHIKKEHVELQQEMRDFGYTHLKDLIDTLGYSMDFIKGPPAVINAEQSPERPDGFFYIDQIKKNMGTLRYAGGLFPHQKQKPGQFADVI